MIPHDPLLLATAVEAVLRAGEIQADRFGSVMRVDKKGVIDLVTDVDVAIERAFRQMIETRFPGHDVLGEELSRGDASASVRSRPCWIFDPLDGTTNYAHGLPTFCSSLALEAAGRIEIAAVFDPMRRELFTAERGGGAYLNGKPLNVSRPSVLLDSLLCTGFPYDVHDTVEEVVGLFGAFVGRARAVRRLGSAALDLCYVAAGRLDGFWEQRLKPWDIAAGVLVVEEAGGRASSFSGEAFDLYRGEVVASNGHIHGEMIATIADFVHRRSGNRTN